MSKENKKQKSFLGFYVVIVLVLFYLVVDIFYPFLSWRMGIQISDWWLAANVIVPLVEIIVCAIIKISKESDPAKKVQIEAVTEILTGVLSAVTGNVSIPSITSGALATKEEPLFKKEDDEEYVPTGEITGP